MPGDPELEIGEEEIADGEMGQGQELEPAPPATPGGNGTSADQAQETETEANPEEIKAVAAELANRLVSEAKREDLRCSDSSIGGGIGVDESGERYNDITYSDPIASGSPEIAKAVLEQLGTDYDRFLSGSVADMDSYYPVKTLGGRTITCSPRDWSFSIRDDESMDSRSKIVNRSESE